MNNNIPIEDPLPEIKLAIQAAIEAGKVMIKCI